MQNALNLILTIKDGQNMALYEFLSKSSAPIDAAMNQVGTVHFARFLPIPNTQILLVITTYDGDFNAYIQAFTALLGDAFNGLLGFCDPQPPLPVQQNVAAFQAFVAQWNLPSGLYSAYPDCTVLNIQASDCGQPS